MSHRVARWLVSLPPLWRWLIIFFLLEAAWFMWLHPLVPSNLIGFVIEFLAGVCVMGLMYGAARGIWWMSGQQGNLLLWRSVAAVLALGVGVVIFVVAYEFRTTISANFHYFIFARR